jgi:cytochrome c peroxidase
MHDGRFSRLPEVLQHYTSPIQEKKMVSVHLKKPIVLSANDKVDLTSFLFSLTDRTFLFNERFSFPRKKNLTLKD